jgi:hypothetical protein
MSEQDALQAFLTHRTSERGSNFLKGWRKKGSIVVFLHRRYIPRCVWVHPIPRVYVKQDKQSGASERKIFTGEWICWDPEAVVKARYRRDDYGRRKTPPQSCPVCKLIDFVYEQVVTGKLDLAQPLFQFDAEDPRDTRRIHTGGFVGMYREEDLSPEEKQELSQARISIKDAYREKCVADPKYLMYVVDANDVSAGVQQALEKGSIGDKLKDVISDEMARDKDKSVGNPFLNPYAFEFIYNDKEAVPDRKYKVRRTNQFELTPAIDLLISGDKPDDAQATRPFNAGRMRTMLEKACLIRDQIPWETLFGKAEEEQDAEDEDLAFPPADDDEPVGTPGRQDFPAAAASVRSPSNVVPIPQAALSAAAPSVGQPRRRPTVAEAEANLALGCDTEGCEGLMWNEETSCLACGRVYPTDGSPSFIPQPIVVATPTPRIRKRGEKK